jgi:hypothetical protein
VKPTCAGRLGSGLILAALWGIASCAEEKPRTIEVLGTYHHPEEGLAFKESVGTLQRTDIVFYDPTGRDVSVSYQGPSETVVTVYVYPTGQHPSGVSALETHFDSVKNDISAHHSETSLLKEQPVTWTGHPMKLVGKKATFKMNDLFNGRKEVLTSEVLIFLERDWFIKFRITYPKDQQRLAEPQISSFMRALGGS